VSGMSGKFKDGFITGVKKEKEIQKEQELLHKKHRVADTNVVIVEKTNAWMWIINKAIAFIKLLATMMLLVLAGIGLFSIVYPNVRAEFIITAGEILTQIKQYL